MMSSDQSDLDFSFAAEKTRVRPPLIDEVVVLDARGPWVTKSGGQLRVLSALDYFIASAFFSYDAYELGKVPDIRGFRQYVVTGLKKGCSIAGTEFHRLRKELFFVLQGTLEATCEDVYGSQRTVLLDAKHGLFIPPFMYHAFSCREDASFLVICNTLFDPDDARTHDTYDLAVWRALQDKYKKK